MARRGRPRRPRDVREPPGPEAALELAAHYLGTRPRSRWEVERRLGRAGADPGVIDATLARLEELGLVDDLAFARWWLEQRDRHAPRGRRMIEAELRQHGVGRATIEALREERAEMGTPDEGSDEAGDELPRTEEERAGTALAAHLRGRPVPDEPRARQRLGMFLVRRGFDPETVRAVIRAASAADEAELDDSSA